MAPVALPRVIVRVCEARDVGSRVIGDNMAMVVAVDPYCQVRCGEETVKTDVKEKTTAPIWQQEFIFGVKKQPLGRDVVFKVYGYNRLVKDVNLGEATLQLSSIKANQTESLTLPLKLPASATEVLVQMLTE